MIDFLKAISGTKSSEIEYNILTSAINYSDIGKKNLEKDIYFLSNVSNPQKRNSDRDVISKNYICIDLDIRQNFISQEFLKDTGKTVDEVTKEERDIANMKYGKLMTDDEIVSYVDVLKGVLDLDKKLNQWSYIIYTGNGLHLYYIGDMITPSIEGYADYVKELHKRRNELVVMPLLVPDAAIVNLGRVLRLPGTINHKMGLKFGMEKKKSYIITRKDCRCDWMTEIQTQKEFEELEKPKTLLQEKKSPIQEKEVKFDKDLDQIAKNFVERNKRFEKKIEKTGYINYRDLYQKINDIELNHIFSQDMGLAYKDSGSNGLYGSFVDPKEKNFIGVSYIKQTNLLCWLGSSRRSRGSSGPVFNTFKYIKVREHLDKQQTYDWFLKNYPQLQQYIEKPKIIEQKITDVDKLLTSKPLFSRGTKALDARFGMFDKGSFIITVGESGSGKTEFCFFQAKVNLALGNKVLFISLEMDVNKLFIRTAKKKASITKSQRNTKNIQEGQKRKFKEELRKMQNLGNEGLKVISLEDTKFDLIAATIEEHQKQGYNLIYIDNLGFITSDEGKESEQVSKISRELKQLTTTLGVSINLLHHYSKGSDKDRTKARGLASIRGSGKIENDADFVLRIYRDFDDYENQSHQEKAEVKAGLIKDREYGEPQTHQLYFDKGEYFDKYIPPLGADGKPIVVEEEDSIFGDESIF